MFKLGDKVKILNKDYATTKDNASISPATVIAVLSTSNHVGILYYIGWKEAEVRAEHARSTKAHLRLDDKLYYIANIDDYTYYLIMYDYELESVESITTNGYNCISCNTYYPYAQANLPNNQLKCYSCRNP